VVEVLYIKNFNIKNIFNIINESYGYYQ
jgi:hypothetical protein